MKTRFSKTLKKYSNPVQAQKMARKYLGKNSQLYPATKKGKKYSVIDLKGRRVNFGQLGYYDFTRTRDKFKRRNYLRRSRKIRGDWKKNKYSPNNLSIHILW